MDMGVTWARCACKERVLCVTVINEHHWRYGKGETLIGKAVSPFLLDGYNVLAIDLRNHRSSQDSKLILLGLYEVHSF